MSALGLGAPFPLVDQEAVGIDGEREREGRRDFERDLHRASLPPSS
jgi:hypothetical protein